jgi:hypothetical protein
MSLARKTVLPRPATTINFRPDFSSERVPHINKPADVGIQLKERRRGIKICSRVPNECLAPRRTDLWF